VIKVMPSDERVLVSGVNMVKRHQRPSQMDPGGIKEFEAPLHISNVAHIDPQDDKPTRVGVKVLDDGRKVRVSRRTGEVIDR
jgi:large subunit ribosomal protein L24